MGLFSKKRAEPIVHPEVGRTIWVPAALDAVMARLGEYSELHSPKHADPQLLALTTAPGWTIIELPRSLHPWAFHNLAFWLLDTPGGGEGTVARSGPSPTHAGYELVRDPEVGDCLCGVDDDGNGWTVSVPTNDIVRPESVPVRSRLQASAAADPRNAVEVLLEDPGPAMNPGNTATVASRRDLVARHDYVVY